MVSDWVNSPWLAAVLIVVVLVIAALVVVVGQGLFMINDIRVEYSRKLIHISLSVWIACWLSFLKWQWVAIAALLLATGVFISKRAGFLKSIHGVRRTTYGEITYALGIALVAYLARESPSVYALAVLNLGFADGLAAVIGIRYGRKKYAFWGRDKEKNGKTLAGALTSCGFVILSGTVFWWLAASVDWPLWAIVGHIIGGGVLLSGLEFISLRGYDNIIIPVATVVFYMPIVF